MTVVQYLPGAVLIALMPTALQCQPSSLAPRVPNTSLQMPSSPPVFGYTTTNAFGNLPFTDPVAIAVPPGETNRLFVAEQRGRVAVITNLANPTRTVFLDISSRVAGGTPSDERGLLGMAFHPGYATNRFFFVFYTFSNTQRVSRFEASPGNPDAALPGSELVLISQVDDYGNHNGGDLHFGPDGYLYVSVGDEGDQNDAGNNSQRIDKDFFSGLLRIDVDKLPGNLPPNPHPASTTNYFVPSDNPFVGATNFNGLAVDPANVRTEFWAVGLRNPWRFAFDRATGTLYCGDVGGGLREEINVIVKGGNYGWAYREGTFNGPKSGQAPGGFASAAPIAQYAHGSATNQGYSVTGGVLYRGERISQLTGAYVFTDYVSGHLWALRPNGTNAVPFEYLTRDAAIAGFGVDPRNGEVLIADQDQDRIKTLAYTKNIVAGSDLPLTLSDTGAFADLATLTPNAGIVPYDLNVPFWSDGAHKTRWFSVPQTNQFLGFNPRGSWSSPTGTVWIKHFELELTNGVASSRKRLETRFIVRNAGGVYGATYRWDSPTNATLVPETGLDETFTVDDGGMVRTQVWHYPGRNECLTCHTFAGGLALGFNTPQLNRNFDYGAGPENQIAALSRAGYFPSPVASIHTLAALAQPTNTPASLEYRTRSYLAANCVACHQPGGTGLGSWDARISTPTSQSGLINGSLNNSGGDPANRVIVPGSLDHSMLLQRLSVRGPGQMPPLASTVLDTNAINLVSAWITNDLPGYQTLAQWQIANFGSTNAPAAAPSADPDTDSAINSLEYLTGTNPNQVGDAWGIEVRRNGGAIEVSFEQIANRGFEVQWTANLLSPIQWSPLDVAGNEPFFSATDFTKTVADIVSTSGSRYYRVRVYEP